MSFDLMLVVTHLMDQLSILFSRIDEFSLAMPLVLSGYSGFSSSWMLKCSPLISLSLLLMAMVAESPSPGGVGWHNWSSRPKSEADVHSSLCPTKSWWAQEGKQMGTGVWGRYAWLPFFTKTRMESGREPQQFWMRIQGEHVLPWGEEGSVGFKYTEASTPVSEVLGGVPILLCQTTCPV